MAGGYLDLGSVADRLTNTLAQGYKDREELARERDMAAVNYQRQLMQDQRMREMQAAQLQQQEAQQARQFQQQVALQDRKAVTDLKAAGITAGAKAQNKNFDQAAKLRNEYMGIPVVKQFGEVQRSYANIAKNAQNQSPAGDMGLIFGIMKMYDPASTVREGEYANAQNAVGVPGQIQNYYNKVLKGERLNPQQRQDFLKQAQGLYQNAQEQAKSYHNQYAQIAQRQGLDPNEDLPFLDSVAGSQIDPLLKNSQPPKFVLPKAVMADPALSADVTEAINQWSAKNKTVPSQQLVDEISRRALNLNQGAR